MRQGLLLDIRQELVDKTGKGRDNAVTPFQLADRAIQAAIDGNRELAHKLLDEAIAAFTPVRQELEELEKQRKESDHEPAL